MALPVTYIDIAGTQVKCIILESPQSEFELQTWRTQFAGSVGVSEIVGGPGMRPLNFNVVLKDKAWTNRAAIQLYIETTLNLNLMGRHGTVQVKLADGTIIAYPDTTFQGFATGRSPLPDYSGTLGINSGTEAAPIYGYFCPGVLKFTQLGGG